MDWTQYASPPQGLTSTQTSRLGKVKSALKRGAGGAKKRLKKEQHGLYMERRKNLAQYDAPVYGEGTQSGRQIDSQVVSATRGKYGQPIADLESQIGSAPARQAQIASYYDQYNTELGNLRNSQNQQAQQAIDSQNKTTELTQQREQLANQQAQQALSADAASRGQTADTGTLAKANQASTARAATGNTQSAALQQAKLAYDNYYGQQQLNSGGSRQAALGKESTHTNSLRSQLLGLQKEAGDFATTTRGTLDESQYQRALSAQALGVKASAAKSTAANQAANRKISQQNADANQQRADWATSPSNPDNQVNGGKPLDSEAAKPPKRDKSAEKMFTKARSLASTAVQSGKLKKGQGKAFTNALVNEKNINDELLAKAATMYALYGGVDAATQKAVSNKYNFKLRLSPSAKKGNKNAKTKSKQPAGQQA